jgi:hypothetical protein
VVVSAEKALDQLKAGGYHTGPGWDATHGICQAHEGEALEEETLFSTAHVIGQACGRFRPERW